MIRRLLPLSLVLLALAACGMPKDPELTLHRVTGSTMRVGLIEHEPWVSLSGGRPSGIEVELVKAFADDIDTHIEWFPGSESEVFEALGLGTLDLVIGGVSRTSPYAKEAALTHPYLTTQTVVGFPDEPGIDPDISSVEVAVEKGTAAEGLLRKTDAVPVPVADVTQADGPRVVENWQLDDLGLVDLGVQLDETDHVMAVRLGENGFMVRLERFLLGHRDLVIDLEKDAA